MTSSSSNSLDMHCFIGGRKVTPHFNVVDGSFPSSPSEISFNERLLHYAYATNHIPLETSQNMEIRERALNQIRTICRSWIQYVSRRMELPEDVVSAAGGQLFTSGSFRLGVHEPEADIDTIVVAPNMCTREDFFGNNYSPPKDQGQEGTLRDPNSLAERIRRHPDVTNFNAVEGAVVPILTFDWEGINIDLAFARLNSTSVPSNFDIDHDSVLDGVDSATEKSLNGPRVTNLIYALVSGTEERYRTFLTVVRCVRKWAKARGLYSNKMGYWGGVNINISVALVIQLYPNASPATLLRRFFLVFKSWRWPTPVLLTKPHDAELGLQVWSQYNVHNARQVAPIITPAYPAMNSSLSISRQTLQIMHEEICRGHDVIDKLWKQHNSEFTSFASGKDKEKLENGDLFAELFEPSDFFISYPYYLSLCIVGPTQQDLQSWAGFVESRLRKLVSDLLGKSLPLSKLQLWPKKLEACCADKLALLNLAQRKNSLTYFIGFKIDQMRMRGNQLNIEQQIQHFKREDLSRFHPLVSGMDVVVRNYKVKELPRILFENQYDSFGGGKEGAMKKRRMLRDSDPKLIMKKKKAKLEAELKAKKKEMERRIQRKKEEIKMKMEADELNEESKKNDQVIKQVDEENENQNNAVPKVQNEDSIAPLVGEGTNIKDEEALLELALDTIQNDTGGKTREEAELDRKKLLAGELLVEGGGGEIENDSYIDNSGANEKIILEQKLDLTDEEKDAEILKRSGYNIVSEDECALIGSTSIKHRFEKMKDNESEEEWKTRLKRETMSLQPPAKKIKIAFRTDFNVIELDVDGKVIDKGDEDFTPSKSWIGRKGGFEFKLGERGLGYYRTGKKVIVPSNISY